MVDLMPLGSPPICSMLSPKAMRPATSSSQHGRCQRTWSAVGAAAGDATVKACGRRRCELSGLTAGRAEVARQFRCGHRNPIPHMPRADGLPDAGDGARIVCRRHPEFTRVILAPSSPNDTGVNCCDWVSHATSLQDRRHGPKWRLIKLRPVCPAPAPQQSVILGWSDPHVPLLAAWC